MITVNNNSSAKYYIFITERVKTKQNTVLGIPAAEFASKFFVKTTKAGKPVYSTDFKEAKLWPAKKMEDCEATCDKLGLSRVRIAIHMQMGAKKKAAVPVKNKVWYEWSWEQLDDHGDIDNQDFNESLSELMKQMQGEKVDICLIRHLGNEVTGEADRQYVYVKDGILPQRFDDLKIVPQRYHNELRQYLNLTV